MNKLKKQFVALSLLPVVLTTVFALVMTSRHPQFVDIITACAFVGLSLGIWILVLFRANRELFAPLQKLVEKLQSSRPGTGPDPASLSTFLGSVGHQIDKLGHEHLQLVEMQENNRRLQEALAETESVARQRQEALDAAQRNLVRETTCISQMTMATQAPLKSLIGFTNLLSRDQRDDQDQCLYELERTGKQLAFLTGMLYDKHGGDHMTTQFSLHQMLDDVLACIAPLANARGCEIYPLFAESCPHRIFGMEPQIKAAVFHYLLQHLADSVVASRALHLEVNYSDDNDLIFVLTPVKQTAEDPGARFKRVLDDCNAILEDGLMAIPIDRTGELPAFSGRNLKAIVVDDNETQSRSLMSRLQHLGIELVEPSEHHMAHMCFTGSYDEPTSHKTPLKHSLPTLILDSTVPVIDTSVIRLRKPIDQTELIAAIELSVSNHASPGNGEVLAVDDSAVNLRLTSLLLEELGYVVHTAGNGHEAVQLAEQCEFDFIIMDIRMPVLDGLQAADAIRTIKGKHLPIIGLSAQVTDQERARVRAAGMNDVLDKPLTRAKLESVLARYDVVPTMAAQEPHGTPLFNKDQALKRANDNPELANELFRLLVFNLPEDRNNIDQAWRHNDRPRFREAIHKLNGAARYCGIPRLATAIDELESIARSGSNAEIAATLKTLNEEVHALLAWYRENPDPFGIGVTPRSPP